MDGISKFCGTEKHSQDKNLNPMYCYIAGVAPGWFHRIIKVGKD